jgi:Cu-Zn family superoxide dismutase
MQQGEQGVNPLPIRLRFEGEAMRSLVVAVFGIFGIVAVGAPPASSQTPSRPPQAKAEMQNSQGRKVGVVTFEQTPHGVLVIADLRDLPPGSHALHVHEVGKCEPPFKTAGDHFNPMGKEHGMKNVRGMHAGDLPNLEVADDGAAHFQAFASGLSLEPGRAGYLFDKDGSAVVVHASADDYVTNPAGNAGDRIACGVVTK